MLFPLHSIITLLFSKSTNFFFWCMYVCLFSFHFIELPVSVLVIQLCYGRNHKVLVSKANCLSTYTTNRKHVPLKLGISSAVNKLNQAEIDDCVCNLSVVYICLCGTHTCIIKFVVSSDFSREVSHFYGRFDRYIRNYMFDWVFFLFRHVIRHK